MLFYAMKEVQGSPWSQLMPGKTLDENLGILLRVADTVSYAHSRGVLHRDLKPHNIMLGEFGEVMDWGAFCPVVGEVAGSASSTLCGTPAYMPPEMARLDIRRQGVASDVYLLGALLYQIVADHPQARRQPAPQPAAAALAVFAASLGVQACAFPERGSRKLFRQNLDPASNTSHAQQSRGHRNEDKRF